MRLAMMMGVGPVHIAAVLVGVVFVGVVFVGVVMVAAVHPAVAMVVLGKPRLRAQRAWWRTGRR